MGWLFSFRGRIGRGLWWTAVFICVAFGLIVALPLVTLIGSDVDPGAVSIFLVLVSIPLNWIAFATSVTRLHDLGRSGWWVPAFYGLSFLVNLVANPIYMTGSGFGFGVFLLLIIIFGLGPLIYLGAFPGQKGSNKYGPDPGELDQAAQDVTANTSVVESSSVQPVEPPGSIPTPFADELRKLKALFDEGIITEDEFQQLKARLLA